MDAETSGTVTVGGPWFEDLSVGQRFDAAPAITLTSGMAAVHRSILGDRLRLALDDDLASRVTGAPGLASPSLVWDVAIGQSTLVTHRVVANLFYRGVAFRRFPHLGDTLRTVTEVVALRENAPKHGRAPTGMAALRITTVDQHDRPVLDFWRCAMLPRRSPASTGHADDLDAIGVDPDLPTLAAPVAGWRLDEMPVRGFSPALAGTTLRVATGDVVSSAPELARLTTNLAAVHHDATVSGNRLVYGGHTIGVGLAQATRALELVTVTGWFGCDHTGPVHEGDTLHSTITVERALPLDGGGGLVHLRSTVDATAPGAEISRGVLDWRFVAVMA